MWVLSLNDMRNSNVENLTPVAKSATKEELIDFMEREKCEPYVDEVNGYRWSKVFRKDGPLEWMNPPYSFEEHRTFQFVGTEDDWAANARKQYRELINDIPGVR